MCIIKYMGKGTAIFLTILFIVLAGGAVIGVDVYLSYRNYTENSDSFDITNITYDLAPSNESAVVSAVITSPKLGYIPKSVRLDIVLKKGGTQYGDPQQITITLGTNQTVEFTLTFEVADIAIITGGGTISLTIEATATPIYIGIPLNFLKMDVPPISLEIIP